MDSPGTTSAGCYASLDTWFSVSLGHERGLQVQVRTHAGVGCGMVWCYDGRVLYRVSRALNL